VKAATVGARRCTRGANLVERAAVGLIVLFLAFGLHRVFVTNINWDEFYYLSFVHLFRGGDLTLPLQTIHVRLFAWLPWVSGNEVEQIFAGRIVMWLASLISAWLIFRIAGRFSSRVGAVFAVILYLSFSYVMDHGASFRADPLCALLFLAAAHLLVNHPARRYATPAAALAMALAMLVSMKSVFYLPTIAVLLAAPLLDSPRPRAVPNRVAVFAVSIMIFLAGLFIWHKLGLAPAPPEAAGAYAVAAGNKTIGLGVSLSAWPYIERALAGNVLTWSFVASGLWIAGNRAMAPYLRADAFMVLSFALPLLSLLVYRNAFPYFFVFLMAAAIIPGAVAVDRFAARVAVLGGTRASIAMAAVPLIAGAGYALNYLSKLPDQTVAQAETVRVVHAMFPAPVPYIDRNSMIASFPKVGFFMSTWGVESYRAANRPVMADLLARRAPPLLIANTSALDLGQPEEAENKTKSYNLFPADINVLRENYIHHWGAIYVAGKRLSLAAGAGTRTFEIIIPGPYTMEAEGTVILDGAPHAPGATVDLTRGSHRMAAPAGQALQVTLRWGRDLFQPAYPPSPQPIYTGF
jgi:hypothetical protein